MQVLRAERQDIGRLRIAERQDAFRRLDVAEIVLTRNTAHILQRKPRRLGRLHPDLAGQHVDADMPAERDAGEDREQD